MSKSVRQKTIEALYAAHEAGVDIWWNHVPLGAYASPDDLRADVGTDFNAWTPAGKAWYATDCHCIVAERYDDTETAEHFWEAILDDLTKGFIDCSAGLDCDTCHPEEA